jgi:hypothetical protein
MGSEPGVVGVVAEGDTVTLAVRDELQDCGDRLVLCPYRKPELGRQADAVGHRNPDVLDHPIGQFVTTARPRCLLFRYDPKIIRRLQASSHRGDTTVF